MNDSTGKRPQTGTQRRNLLMGGSALAALFVTRALLAASGPTNTTRIGDVTLQAVHFDNNGIRMAGNVYLPSGFKAGGKYAAIVSVHPGGGVKEQTAGLYAQRLAEQGFVTLAFDASHQGASGGEPRLLDDPMRRGRGVFNARQLPSPPPHP